MKPLASARPQAASIETLEPRLLLAAADPTAYAQFLLELINLQRSDPVQAAADLGIDLNEGLAAGTISDAPKQPLAFDPFLIDAAQMHTQWMVDNDLFQHTGIAGSTPAQRMIAAGFTFTPPAGSDENLAFEGIVPPALPDLLATLTQIAKDLFTDGPDPARNDRLNLMSPLFEQVGIAALMAPFQGLNAVAVTEDFAFSNGDPFLTGVVYDDRLVFRDNFYTPGEGIADVTVTATDEHGTTFTTTGNPAGGYSLQVPSGVYTIDFSGGGLAGAFQFTGVVVGAQNVKQDLPLAAAPGQANLVIPATAEDTLFSLPGDDVSFSVTVRNIGLARVTDDFDVTIFLADHPDVTAADTAVASFTVSGLNIGATSTGTLTFAAPGTDGTYYFVAIADAGEVVPESNETDNAGTENTLIVGQPDLVADFGKITLADVMVPGDTGKVAVVVANIGEIPSQDAFDIAVYATPDPAGHAAGEVLLTTFTAEGAIEPDSPRTFNIKVNITDVLPQGTWYILADVDSGNTVDESDESNNTVVDTTARDLVWEFGSFAGRQNVKLVVHDPADVETTFALSGGGWGEVLGGGFFNAVNLHDTTDKSNASIKTEGGAHVSVGGIDVPANIKSLSASAVDLAGDVDIAGAIATLTLGDVAGGIQILTHTDSGILLNPKTQLALTLGDVHDLALVSPDEPLKSLTVLNWGGAADAGNTITAPSLGSLTVKGQKANAARGLPELPGDFAALLDVAGAVGTAKITGGLTLAWDALSVKSLTVNMNMTGFALNLSQGVDPTLSALGSLTVNGWMDDSHVYSDGNIGTVSLAAVRSSDIFAAVAGSPPAHALPDPATDFVADAGIKSVGVSGKLVDIDGHSTIDVDIAAAFLGSVSLRNALATNTPSAIWGLAGHALAKYDYRDAATSYSWNDSLPPPPTVPGGDFLARLA